MARAPVAEEAWVPEGPDRCAILITGADGNSDATCPTAWPDASPMGACAARLGPAGARRRAQATRCWGPISTPCRSTIATPSGPPSPPSGPSSSCTAGRHSRRSVRDRDRCRLLGERDRHAPRGRGGCGGRRAHGLRVHRLRVRRHRHPPLPESDPPCPTSVYGMSKLAGSASASRADHRAHQLAVRRHGKNIVKTRCAWPRATGSSAS